MFRQHGWSRFLLVLLGLLIGLAIIAGIVRVQSLLAKAKRISIGPPIPTGPALPWPAPPIDQALTPQRHVLVGLVEQPSTNRHPFEPSALVDVENWLSACPVDEQRGLGYDAQGRWLEAWVTGRPAGRPVPVMETGARFVVIVGKSPGVISGPDWDVLGDASELIAVYPYTDTVVAEAKRILRLQGRYDVTTSSPAHAP
ncbi:MAG: hypothetical protein ABIG44_06320 [Planctomycetota bacterium]